VSLPRVLLRVEGAVLLAVTLFLYARSEASWRFFALLLLVPDVGMIGYALGNRVGAAVYNVFHTAVLPVVLAAIGVIAEARLAVAIALIWLAHIGMDRALGFGLKYPTGFRETHLGRV
jgi:hypothetical protein